MTSLLLPKLKDDCDVKSGNPGTWDAQAPTTFNQVASSLDYKAPGEVKNISSVPTIWARPLSMEMALHNDQYPIRKQLIEQWQGMLAAIALAEVRGFPLSAQLLELGLDTVRSVNFGNALYQLLPNEDKALYALAGKNAWQDVYIWLWNNQPVGMTSPSTLVVPSEEGKWTGLPWWDPANQRLVAPQTYLNANEKEMLSLWLAKLSQEINNEQQYQGKRRAINSINTLINEFRSSLGVNPNPQLLLSDDPQFFGIGINRGVLTALNKPVKAPAQPSSVQIIPSREKVGKALPLLIIDHQLAKIWNESPQNIWINEGKTLASLNIQDLKSGNLIWKTVKYVEPNDLFLPEFTFIDQENALPGGLELKATQPLTFNGRSITPLIPINPLLLDYFTVEELIKKIQLQPFVSNQGSQVRVILDLPLSGVKQTENYRIFKEYALKEENALPEVPILELWPNFKAQGWKEYYTFYYDGDWGEETFQIAVPNAENPYNFKDGKGIYQMAKMETFPEYIICQDRNRKMLGLILLKMAEEINATGVWKVGVDFGTSFTNIYINKGGIPERLQLENLNFKITASDGDTRYRVLFEYLIPESFIPVDQPLPLSTVLTIRGNTDKKNEQVRAIFDGRIYIPSTKFKPQEDWIKTNLKWETENLRYNQIFLKHLGLHISALAAQAGVGKIQWAFSYPSAYSKGEKNRYIKVWNDIIKEWSQKTGIEHQCPQTSAEVEYFCTESLAFAQYFADHEGENLVNTTCIDVGGGTSDISIWELNKLIYQCSVQLAGRDIFSQFLEMNPKFLERRLGVNLDEWKGLKGGSFNAKLDVLLRLDGEKWLKEKKVFIEDQEDFKGLVRLTAIATSGLYYYVGMLLKVLREENNYNRDEITPVYIGGNGSRFLHWLAEGGEFNSNSEVNLLFSRMLSKASGFDDIEVSTKLSKNPKDEAACGLVLNDTTLEVPKKVDSQLIAGETCIVNQKEIKWDSRLNIEDEEEIKSFKVPDLSQLSLFLYEFHRALRDLEIEGIASLKDYTRSADMSENQPLWTMVKRELEATTLTIKGKTETIRIEPPFILGLKALLKVLGKQWAGK